MKKLFAVLFVLILFVLGALGADLSPRSSAKGEQKFSSLPIGYNLDEYVHSVQVLFGTVSDGNTTYDTFRYNRKNDGALESFAVQRLREVANRFVPKSGKEATRRAWGMDAITDGIGGLPPSYSGESKPATIAVAPPADGENGFYPILRNGKWEVPEEVFGKVKFQFGWGVGYYIPGVTDLEIRLYHNGIQSGRLSTREKTSDLKDLCELAGIILGFPDVAIPNEIARAQPLRLKWDYAEIDLYTQNESVTFMVNGTEQDGKAIRWSNPPPSFFTPPPPKIASLTRVRHTTEITVSADSSTTVHLEFSETLGGRWYSIPKYPQPTSLETGSSKFTHATEAPQCFYRVRLAEPQLQR